MSLINRKFLYLLVASMVTTGLFGQKYIQEGRIITYDSIPLILAKVEIKGSDKSVVTDFFGDFAIEVAEGDKLVFSATGFGSKTVKAKAGKNPLLINLKLRSGEANIDKAISEGEHIRVSDIPRFKALSREGVDYSTYSNIYEILRTFSAVNIVGDAILIRGNTSIQPGSNSALLVVDGVIVSQATFAATAPSAIKRIRVLKGSEASIYGSQGGNGVVEVETKRGNE